MSPLSGPVPFIFALSCLPYLALAAFFTAKAAMQRRLVSVLMAWLCTGWLFAFAREMHWLSRSMATVPAAMVGSLGLLTLIMVLNREGQR